MLRLSSPKSAMVLVSEACGRGVSAHLYKMLLYDEGAFFKPHQESVIFHATSSCIILHKNLTSV
jgi:hypothetical protein